MTNTTTQPLGPRQQALVAALRSGRFAQAREALHTKEGFCCLGVACEISGLGRWQEPDAKDRRPRFRFFVGSYNIYGEVSFLPEAVREYYGFKTADGDFSTEGEDTHQLSEINDKGASFREIADLIEVHSATLFLEPR